MKNWGNNFNKEAYKPTERKVDIPEMSKEDRELLLSICQVQSPSDDEGDMHVFVKGKLDDMGLAYTSDATGNIYVTKGNAELYPCIVSHMDQVHDKAKGYCVITSKERWWAFDTYTMRPHGIGGDDKVGIFMCFKALIEFPNVKVVFFSREEIGYVGSAACDMSFFDNTTLVLQADRNGNSDWITNTNGSEVNGKVFRDKIAHLLDKYSYKPCTGVGTDVGKLKNRGLKVAAANLSCGYFEAHTDNEFIVLPDIQCAWMLMKDICDELGNEVQEHEDTTHKGSFYRGYNHWDEDWGYGVSTKSKPECVECGHSFTKGTGLKDLICSFCYSSYIRSGMQPQQIQEFLEEMYPSSVSKANEIKRGDEVIYKDSMYKDKIFVVQMEQGQWLYIRSKLNPISQFWTLKLNVEKYRNASPNTNDNKKVGEIDMTKEEIIKRYFYKDRIEDIKKGDIMLTLGGSIVEYDGDTKLKSFPPDVKPGFTLDASLTSNGLFVFKSEKRVRMFINKFSNNKSMYEQVSKLIYN